MRILALDLSTSTGWAVLESEQAKAPNLEMFGILTLPKHILEYGKYPFCYHLAAYDMAERVARIVEQIEPDQIVIEETNLGKNRYSQKALEFIHCLVLEKLHPMIAHKEVVYLSSSIWRQALGLQLTKDQKKTNAKLAKAKREAAATGAKLDKTKLGIKGKVSKKHVAINYVNDRFGLKLKVKDDDVADAVCLGLAALMGAEPCDGT